LPRREESIGDLKTPDSSLPNSRVGIVTGVGKGGLGYAIARGLATMGLLLVVADHPDNAESLEEVVAELSTFGTVIGVTADVTREADVNRTVGEAVSRFGRLDVLVNNAGVMLRRSVFDTTLEEWDHVVRTNLTGTWLTNRAVGRQMCEQQYGRIVNISSVYADRVGPLPESAYYASKAGIANLTRAMAGEFGPYGVTVNCVAPGVFFPTAMTKPLQDDPATLELMTKRTMLGRLGDPNRDIHGIVEFLVSDSAAYITGQTIFVDGGWSAW
jgi:gluconate 5-dehydrogenase